MKNYLLAAGDLLHVSYIHFWAPFIVDRIIIFLGRSFEWLADICSQVISSWNQEGCSFQHICSVDIHQSASNWFLGWSCFLEGAGCGWNPEQGQTLQSQRFLHACTKLACALLVWLLFESSLCDEIGKSRFMKCQGDREADGVLFNFKSTLVLATSPAFSWLLALTSLMIDDGKKIESEISVHVFQKNVKLFCFLILMLAEFEVFRFIK